MGRRVAERSRGHGVGLIRNKLAHLDAAGVVRIGRITRVAAGRPVASGEATAPDVATVGVVHRLDARPLLPRPAGVRGRTAHRCIPRGVAAEPGVYFLGLDFQYALASATLQGLDRDTRHVVRHLTRYRATVPAATPARPAGGR